MQVGVPKEIKVHEYRVGLVPATVRELTARGHQVLVEQGAGQGVGYDDGAYAAAGATIVPDAASAWRADLVVKVKEPQPAEFPYLRPELTLFPTCTWPRTRARPRPWWIPAAPPWPTRRSPTPSAACPCWRPCRR